jgi:hypothetical protein
MADPDLKVWLGKDHILRIQYPQNCNVTLEVMELVHQRRLELSTEPLPVLVYADSVAAAEYDAQLFASRADVAARISAMGIIVKSIFTRAMSDLFMRYHRPPYPTRIFRDEQPALEWLAQFLPQDSVSSAASGTRADWS